MRDFKKILVPTDFSAGAEAAYKTAVEMASRFDGKVDLIHIIRSSKYWNESIKRIGLPVDPDKEVYPRIVEEAELQLENLLQQKISAAVRGKYYLKINRKSHAGITEFAEKNNYDLIVMGAKGAHESSMFRGGTTEKVIRHSKVPVFAIDKDPGRRGVENIVVPSDASKLSFTAFPVAVKLASMYGAKVTLFHVLELYGTIGAHFPDQYNYEKIERDAVYNSLINKLKKFLKESGIANIRIENAEKAYENVILYNDGNNGYTIPLKTKVVKGFSAHYEIEKYSQESADIVAIATHGRSGFAHLIMGSTAEKVAQYVEKPVITVRPEEKLFER